MPFAAAATGPKVSSLAEIHHHRYQPHKSDSRNSNPENLDWRLSSLHWHFLLLFALECCLLSGAEIAAAAADDDVFYIVESDFRSRIADCLVAVGQMFDVAFAAAAGDADSSMKTNAAVATKGTDLKHRGLFAVEYCY